MNLLRRSRAEDIVDRWNNFWTLLIFLVLALITWLILFNVESSERATEPAYTTNCWTPSQFTRSHEDYTNTVCGNAFNDMINKRNSSNRLYRLLDTDESIYSRPENNANALDSSIVDPESSFAKSAETEHRKLIYPFALFIFAILLKVPYVIFNMISGCFGSFNMDQTLGLGVQAQSMNERNRRKIIHDIAVSVSEDIKPRQRSISVIYLSVKLVCCCVLILAIIGLSGFTKDTETDQKVASKYVLLCDFDIRALQNIHAHTVQCIFSPMTGRGGSSSQKDGNSLYDNLTTVVFAYLGTLLTANVISLIAWIYRLAQGPYKHVMLRTQTGSVNSALDLQLLLLFTHDTAGSFFAEELVQNLSDSTSKAGHSGNLGDNEMSV